MLVNRHRRRRAGTGSSMLELLVTVLVAAVGLLGMAKLQACALAEGQVSRVRATATLLAESLAGAMRSNPAYWAATTTPLPQFTVASDGTVTDAAGTLVTASTCLDTKCTPAQLAHVDAQDWARQFVTQFPTGIATVSCALGNGQTACDIALAWNEHHVAVNRSAASAVATATASTTSNLGNTYVLHVLP